MEPTRRSGPATGRSEHPTGEKGNLDSTPTARSFRAVSYAGRVTTYGYDCTVWAVVAC